MPRTTSVLIVGGGVSGLTTAYDLTRAGVDCLVIDKANRLGGLIRTESHEGFLMDAGPDAFLVQKPEALALAKELGLEAELVPTNPELNKVYVLHRGRLRALPEGMRLTVPTRMAPLLGSDLFSLRGKLRLLLEPFIPGKRDASEESIASFVTRRFGEEALERVGEPLLAGIHCGDPKRLSMTRLFPNLVALEKRYGSVTRGMVATRPRGETTVFVSFARGMRTLIEALARALPEGTIRKDTRARHIERVQGDYVTTLDSGETIRSDWIVLALPIRESEKLVRGLAPGIADTLARIPTVSTAVAFLGFPREEVDHPLDGYGFVVPFGEPNRLLAGTFVSTKFPHRSPDDAALFRAFLGGPHDPGAMAMDDADLLDLARIELSKVIGPLPEEPLVTNVVRWTDRTPQVRLGHGEILDALARELEGEPGLFIVGNGLEGVGIPDSVRIARALAESLAALAQQKSRDG